MKKPWNGGHLDHDSGSGIGELVLLSDLPAFETRISNGHRRGQTFREYWQEKSAAGGFSPEYPMLLKLLSTGKSLSVQVHPSDEDVKKLGLPGRGKYESWIFLQADADAKVYLGLKPGLGAEALREFPRAADPFSLMNTFTPAAGDVFVLEPGLIHATAGRTLFFEVQQSSDHTFRVFDFDHGRELHLDQAAAVLRQKELRRFTWKDDLVTPAFSARVRAAVEGEQWKVQANREAVTYLGPPAVFLSSGEESEIRWGSTIFFESDSSFSIRFPEGGDSASSSLPFSNRKEARWIFSSFPESLLS